MPSHQWFFPLYFNSRPYTRGDFSVLPGRINLSFQLSPLHEGRPIILPLEFVPYKFQLSPLHEGRPCLHAFDTSSCKFQLSPLHEGRRDGVCSIFIPAQISTLAPTRGATLLPFRTFRTLYISTLAPTRGATPNFSNCVSPSAFQLSPLHEGRLSSFFAVSDRGNFNSRPYTRGDLLQMQ